MGIVKIPESSFIEWLNEKQLSERTIKEYKYYLTKLKELGYLNQSSSDVLINRYNNGVCRALIKNLKSFILRNRVETNLSDSELSMVAAIDIPKKVRGKLNKKPETISFYEVQEIYKILNKEHYKIMLILSYRCALRISELFNIKSNDFNWKNWKSNQEQNGLLRVDGKGKKRDTILVKPHTMEMVQDFINKNYDPEMFDPNEPLFNSLGQNAWRENLANASKKAIGRKINPHLLRHSYATYLLESGWDIRRIQIFLRHQDISSTQIYAHVSKKQLGEDYGSIE